MSQDLRRTPSDLLGIVDPVVSYYFNKAIWKFGSTVDGELSRVEQKAKNARSAEVRRMMVLNRWVPPPKEAKGRFKDPAIKFS